MTTEIENRSFIRFLIPTFLIICGIVITNYDALFGAKIDTHLVTTFGFATYTIGCFSFVVLINKTRNPICTEQILERVSEVLIVYAGILVFLFYKSAISEIILFGLTSAMFVIGVSVAVILNASEYQYEDINPTNGHIES